MLNKDVELCWSDAHKRAWGEVKVLIASAPVLAYYKPGEPLEVQSDGSQAGLGARRSPHCLCNPSINGD